MRSSSIKLLPFILKWIHRALNADFGGAGLSVVGETIYSSIGICTDSVLFFNYLTRKSAYENARTFTEILIFHCPVGQKSDELKYKRDSLKWGFSFKHLTSLIRRLKSYNLYFIISNPLRWSKGYYLYIIVANNNSH